MTGGPKATPTVRAQSANDLSTAFAELLPRSASDVSSFLFEAAYALGEREADLARLLGVTHPTLSTWKRRGAIPDQHIAWFNTQFVRSVFRTNAPKQQNDFHNIGVEVALTIYRQTDFDPFQAFYDDNLKRIEQCFRLIGPFSRLGLFVLHRLERDFPGEPAGGFIWRRVAPKVLELARLGTSALSESLSQ